MEAWSKLKLGWVDAVTITESTRDVRVPAVTDEPLVVKIPAVPDKPQEYYLLENRQKVGFDTALPGAGILVWHVDESVTGFRTAQSKPEHKLLHLVEADGRNDLDRGTKNGGNRGDAGDPWAGPPRRRVVAGGLLGLLGAIFVGLAVYRATRGRNSSWSSPRRPSGPARSRWAPGSDARPSAGRRRRAWPRTAASRSGSCCDGSRPPQWSCRSTCCCALGAAVRNRTSP
jgi:hypothetical protein